jgi:hypothetical protein
MKLTFAGAFRTVWSVGAGVAVGGWMPEALAQTSHYFAGLAVDGQPIMVDLYSPEKVSDQTINFVYALGNEQISGQANCSDGAEGRTWTTLEDGVVHTPQSPGTHNMLAVVCGYSTLSAASAPAESVALYPSIGREPENLASSSSSELEDSGLEDSGLEDSGLEDSGLEDSGLGDSELGDSGLEDAVALSGAEAGTQTVLVFDPPSNVRMSPGGTILCSVDASTYINIYGHSGSWYQTDICGQMGVIDISQIQF